jgi:biofilm PGA synthesis N-glycosyltransferase PgaC
VTAERIPLLPDSEDCALLPKPPEPEVRGSKWETRGPVPGELECSVGVMAYNEEANIAHSLDSILRQRLTAKRITEVVVVASGCEDRTAAIVAEIASREPRVRLIEQLRREGKASAINLFISVAQSPVLAMVSADVVVDEGTFDALLQHFEDPAVGMAGGHPIPVNESTTFLGHAVQLQWRLHDRVARKSPKMGEIVGFRNVIPKIPFDTAVDELSIQAIITQLGYRLVYEPEAVAYNRGPATVQDFLRQRRRIYAGHLRIREQQAYSASTMSAWRACSALLGSESFTTPKAALWSIGTIGLEATARVLGRYDVLRRHGSPLWEMCDTTKSHIAEAANAQSQHNVAVFHIVNFHRLQLEIGVRASRQLTKRLVDHLKQALGPKATVCVQLAGTFVVLLPGDREGAERAASALVERFEAAPVSLKLRGATTKKVTLACGVIAFSEAGPPLSRSISMPVSQLEVDSASATR